ncbi:hypothetical protein Desaci_4114 [Desulfosporosinus acidiphilus SJ4]|uniref:Uncharacterized protein n=1 Tax=Desulfosporosinus acidiphilus (strain DSM 22704 / JCM 16185 / SJ4) TaxID=646529 RepID=I4DB03_DESAJ|nr:hypothetical protein [Desulfosporosinus acidiphilus]AFM42977.1 hypothetical protein Desaci_4114 [Desulfosporosinus acidiphilus SJ4]
MSENVFYADLDMINGKGVLVTGHGKGLVQRNSIINGEYIANDMVRLVIEDGKLLGYQGYIKKEDDELTEIKYLLYFYDESELKQPLKPTNITVDEYLKFSKHNIDIGSEISALFNSGKSSVPLCNTFDEYEDILKKANGVRFISVPYTADENERASFINEIIN